MLCNITGMGPHSYHDNVWNPDTVQHSAVFLYNVTGMRPHGHHEHVHNTDTVLMHHYRGLKAQLLQTGQPLTALPLYQELTVLVTSLCYFWMTFEKSLISLKCRKNFTIIQPETSVKSL